MNADNKKLKVNICLGSSCFSRGSKDTLLLLQEYIQSHDLEDTITLTVKVLEPSTFRSTVQSSRHNSLCSSGLYRIFLGKTRVTSEH